MGGLGALPALEALTTTADEVEGRLVLHHALDALHPATSHRCIFPCCSLQSPILTKQPGQQPQPLRAENTQNKEQAEGLQRSREAACQQYKYCSETF